MTSDCGRVSTVRSRCRDGVPILLSSRWPKGMLDSLEREGYMKNAKMPDNNYNEGDAKEWNWGESRILDCSVCSVVVGTLKRKCQVDYNSLGFCWPPFICVRAKAL